ncbi:hypothetical protein [Spirillospora sp. NPDC047279]|uniref:hypothetical protein n=1 Tax=Spirillospora sp. NPDC047279 TaxID=3155478 RepID=UPI0033C246C1
MTLRFLGKDPDSKDGDSPAFWHDDTDNSVLAQGWKEEDPTVIAELLATSGSDRVPSHEAIVRFPGRLLPVLRELLDDDTTDTR